ncbi:hypothetical protein LHYA1_G002900 [Lachnellula hyalina]|uniref:Uncharacterized protein n=1 Tax=Lachnellula hyalina TaxID=1316788 RepID=A0A8H8R7Y5_9HELO|nr:uncharacterized protein LHYA1_G002900 [Lachnellula hyalina]TVY29271.1 hypothetical protein LHYA1_G002900 [Lachnellula hyalina]
MAFRQPTFQPQQRQHPAPAPQPIQTTTPRSENLADSQEWILFSPTSVTASTARTRTQASDFDSLDTAAGLDIDLHSSSSQAVDEEDEEEGTEDGELDSLDSHLHEFRTEPSVYRGETSGTVLPTHDGLGSFRVNRTSMGPEVQEQLYSFERYNPRRIKRRRASDDLAEEEAEAAESERTRRVEKWRMEQSRLLVDEIQKETRRRKMSMNSARRATTVSALEREQEDVASMSVVEDAVDEGDGETFWSRITKRVIRDLMGVDDELLSIIFGESLPKDDDLSTTPLANDPRGLITAEQSEHAGWEYRLLERVARELGILVNQLSDHPGAFSTYLKTQQTPLPYAGLPMIPESSRDPAPPPPPLSTSTQLLNPEFQPTLPVTIPTSTSLATEELEEATPRQTCPITREEWERDLDIKMVFRYLRTRFSTSSSTSPTNPTSPNSSSNHPNIPSLASSNFTTAHLATASTADTAARAARVRQHHPLVTGTRRRSVDRRTWGVSMPGGGVGVGLPGIERRASSSCATSERRKSGSSRHYWDFGGSVGSGGWGEV